MHAPRHKEILHMGTAFGDIHWAVARAPAPLSYAANGYVHLPPGHPWVDWSADRIPVTVPGGLTYCAANWVGFSTVHAWDVWPDHEAMDDIPGNAVHWTVDKVVEETLKLASAVDQVRILEHILEIGK